MFWYHEFHFLLINSKNSGEYKSGNECLIIVDSRQIGKFQLNIHSINVRCNTRSAPRVKKGRGRFSGMQLQKILYRTFLLLSSPEISLPLLHFYASLVLLFRKVSMSWKLRARQSWHMLLRDNSHPYDPNGLLIVVLSCSTVWLPLSTSGSKWGNWLSGMLLWYIDIYFVSSIDGVTNSFW